MRVFDCTCTWRFVIGEEHVYGPIYEVSGASGASWPVYSQGRLMTREEFDDQYADCAYRATLSTPSKRFWGKVFRR